MGWHSTPVGGIGQWGRQSNAYFTGTGSPVGAVTPSNVGDVYVDDTPGAPKLWQATGLANTDWVQIGGGGSQPVTTAKVSLTAAQLLAIDSEPVSIVPAPGPNKIVLMISVAYRFTAGGTPYTNLSLALQLGAVNNTNNFFNGSDSDSEGVTYLTYSEYGPSAIGTYSNQPIIVNNDGNGNPTLGDGTVVVSVGYVVQDLT